MKNIFVVLVVVGIVLLCLAVAYIGFPLLIVWIASLFGVKLSFLQAFGIVLLLTIVSTFFKHSKS